jgi:cyclophilin family peptidyl-prolyl cis-trans isomerase
MIMKHLLSIFLLFISTSIFAAQNPSVLMDTSEGNITIELFATQSPKTVSNFLDYVQTDAFKETTFHRIIKDFMIQGGGFKVSGEQASTLAAVKNESRNGLHNDRGTIAMARTNNPHSATRQFFINHSDNYFLDGNSNKWGYTVFGKVTSGMDIVDRIARVKTGSADKPEQDIIINSIILIDAGM